MTTRSPQTINGIKLHNAIPNEPTLQVQTNRFVISFGTDTKRVFYEIKDESIKGEPFNVILIMICYEISGHQLCQNVDFITSFFYSIVFHLRTQIPKLLKYHKHIELIRKFFNEPSLIQHMVIPVSAFNLEVHKSRLSFISKSSKAVSSSIRKNLEEYGAFLGDSCSQIATALSKMSIQAQAPAPAQPKPENVWTQRQMKRSSETQTQTQTADSVESATQTQPVSICEKTTQTTDSFAQIMRENAGLKEEIARLQELLKDNSDLKRKISQLEKRLTKTESKSEEIPFTLEDHARFMKEQRDIFEKEKAKLEDKINILRDMNKKVIENGRAELKEFKNSSMEYFRKELLTILSEYPATPSEIGHILRISNQYDMIGPLSSWSMNTILQEFNRKIEKGERLAPSRFFEFWTECILPRIDELSPQILHTLRDEWVRFRSMCWSSNGDDTFALQVNLVFSQYIQDYKNKKYDGYVVPFFNILIHSCKNLIILVGLVNVHYGEKETPTVVDTVYEEFVCLMTLPEPLTVLKEIVELSKKKLAEAEENPYPMPPVFNKLVYGIELPSPSFFETLAESL
jgi:uncharacterized coiled-coil protein SlyX